MPTYTIYIAAALILFLSVIFFLRRKRRGGGSRPGSAAGSEAQIETRSSPWPSRSAGTAARKKVGAKKKIPEFPEAPVMSKAYPESPTSAAYAESDDVALGISSPGCAKPSQNFTIKFVAYQETEQKSVEQLLNESDPGNKILLDLEFCKWKRGTEIAVRLYGENLQVEEEIQKFTWAGKRKILNFDVTVSKDVPAGASVNVKTDVLIAGIVIARLRHSIKIDQNCSTAGDEKFVKGNPYKDAFASYAREDTDIVIGRLSEIERNGVKIYWDRFSLETNKKWKDQLDKAIKDTQVFMLFWSSHARVSEWVTWEWETALKYKGLDGIEPHPLEDPAISPPPDELKELHFDDKYLYFKKTKKTELHPALND